MSEAKEFEISAIDTTIKTFNRFMKLVNRNEETGCWLWAGCKSKNGYGVMSFKGKQVRSNRFSYAFFNGPIPSAFCVCHKCDNPSCVNPDHLFIGTNKDNQIDCSMKDRGGLRSKLTVNDVIEIKKLLKTNIMQSTIALLFNVQDAAISKIKHNKRWSYVTI
jgi:hypothetical protein